jgi:UDP-N-acetylglucosamine 2-epimerase (non-hydrolysing)
VLLLAHPRLVARAEAAGVDLHRGGIVVARPLPYPEMVAAVLGSGGVVTDSGGLQKEAFLLGRLCTTVRTETEWTETLEAGWNVLAGTPDLLAQLPELVARPLPPGPQALPYGDGHAAPLVVRTLTEWAGVGP